ncbi:MAG: response regulator [Aphanothece sp. CMT-3BRIN-NPC111]|jgi:chemosensory pili system protein ChpA (sensor histidine kinase/response regulator)|nr:response regulator [Aphanothece sp. CMT-3BRIN-NPC111]
MQPEQQQRIMGYFIEEAKDHLNTIEQGLLNLQNTIEDSEMVNEVFRAAHSVKGGAAMLGISSVQKTAHRLEDCFKVLQQYPVKVDQKLESLFLRVFDILQELVEQLAGPFGLKDETASDIMSGVEPIFEELNNHLGQLVKGTAGDSTSGAEELQTAPAKTKTLKPDRKALQEAFQRDVLAQLREMLQLFKQPDSSFNRQQVQEICDHIESLGEQLNLSAWSRLLETAKIAIANPQNSYRTLAGIVIKEIKHAQELILAGREAEVVPSQQLKDLLPQTEAAVAAALNIPTRTDSNFAGMLQADNTSVPVPTAMAAVGSMGIVADKLAPAIPPNYTEKPAAYSNSESYISESTGAELSPQNFRDTEAGAISFPPLHKQKNSGKSAPARAGANHNEPEVGMAELNSLADLFEGEAPDLDETWEQEEIISNGETANATDALASVNGDFENDFSDLLGEIDGQISDSTEVSQQDDFMLLFGDDISSKAAEPEKGRSNKEDDFISHLGLDFSPPNDGFSELLFEADTPDFLRAEATPEDDLTSLFSDSIEWENGSEQLTLEDSLDFSLDASTTPSQELRDDDFLNLIGAEDVNKASQAETSNAEDLGISPGAEESLSDWFTGLDENESLLREDQYDSSSSHLDKLENSKIELLADNPEALESWQLEQVENPEQYLNFSDSASDWQDLVFDEEQTVDIGEELERNGLFKDEVALAEAATNLSDLFESSQLMPELPKLLENLAIDDGVGIELINDELPSDDLLTEMFDGESELDTNALELSGSESEEEADLGLDDILWDASPDATDPLSSFGDLEINSVAPISEMQASEAPLWEDTSEDSLETSAAEGEGDAINTVGANPFSLDTDEMLITASEDEDEWDLFNPVDETLPGEQPLLFDDVDATDRHEGFIPSPIADELDLDQDGTLNNLLSFNEQGDEDEDSLFEETAVETDAHNWLGNNIEFEESAEAESRENVAARFEQQPAIEEALDLGQKEWDFQEETEESPDFDALDDLFEAESDAIATSNAALIDSASSVTSPEAISWEEELGEAALELLPDETSQATLNVDENIEDLFEVETPEATETLDFGTDMLAPETLDEDGDIESAAANAIDAPATIRELEALVSLEEASSSDELFETEMPITTDDLDFDEDWDLESTTSVTSESSPAPLELETADLLESLATDEEEWGDITAFLEAEGERPLSEDGLSLETSEEEDLDFAAQLNSLDEFDELESMLGEDAPTSSQTFVSATSELDGADEFDELEAMLGEDAPTSSPTFVSATSELDGADEFDELEAMLGEDATSTAAIASAGTDEFDELEALLDEGLTVETPVTQVASSPAKSDTPAPNVIDDEFGDLEKLLQQADQKMGGMPTAKPVAGQPRARTRPRPQVFEQTMRVPVKHLDNLSNLVGELVVNRNSLEQDQERMRQFLDNLLNQVQQLSDVGSRMQNLYERSLLENSLIASRHNYRNLSKSDAASSNNHPSGVEYDPLEMDRFTPVHLLSQEMIELIVRVRESASDIEFLVDETDQVARMLRQVTTQLQEGLTRSRMVPFAQTADRLQRGVRDNAIKQGKQVELNIEGRETLIDKVILEHLTDPLTHMVNNALAHGVEKPEVRQAAGKPPLGSITVRAFHQGNQTVISVSDDGAGIDAERVKAKALKMGLITPEEAKIMSRLDVYDLLFHPGFSIKDQADELAGRGVGMDVVRTSLMDIRGTINTDSTLGQGTTFTIRLPLTLSIGKALSCISEKARIAFPMDGVEDMLDVPNASIQINAEGQRCILWRDTLLPFQTLSELLTYNRQISRGTVYGGNREDDMISIVVLRSTGNFLAIEVDQVLGEQEIVIKQLEGPVPKPVGVAGATVLGDGRIMPIADVLELIDLSRGVIRKEGSGGSVWPGMQFPTEAAEVKTDPMVLIVDDSITVRELLSMTFNKAGYRVEQARDGQEAWDKLRSGLPCDIVFCDIEMPRMDGLDLLSRIQKDASLNHLPVAMLTSRGADRHRQMAADLGASGYFTKPYLEEALLDAAQRMMKGEVLLTSNSNA